MGDIMQTRYNFIENDKRILEQKLRKHQLSHAELAKMAKNLPDDSASGEEIAVYEEEAVEQTY